MRITKLKSVSVGVAIFVLCAAVGTALLRSLPLGTEVKAEDSLLKQGAQFFARECAQCHFTEKRATKIGPGFKGLFKREKLPVSGRPVTAENVRNQMRDPFKDMPEFRELEKKSGDAIVAYLNTL